MFHYFLQENDLVLLVSSPNFWLEEWWLPECNCCSYSSQKRSQLVGYYFCEWEMVTVWAECIIVMYWCTMGQYFSFYVCHELQIAECWCHDNLHHHLFFSYKFLLCCFPSVLTLSSQNIYYSQLFFPQSWFKLPHCSSQRQVFLKCNSIALYGGKKHVKLT